MISTSDGILIDIDIDGQKLTTEFVERNNIEIYAFRMVLTAGFALPTFQMVMVGFNESYFRKFIENNQIIRISVGTSTNELDTFDVELVGHDLRKAEDDIGYVLKWGAVIRKGNLNSLFLKDKLDMCYSGNATAALTECWEKEIKTKVISNYGRNTPDVSRKYKRNQKCMNQYLADIWIHTDLRPSFPLVTINKNGDLVLKDFQKVKLAGKKYTFVPGGNPKYLEEKMLPYDNNLDAVSYKSYVNRQCGYEQITGINSDTGKLETLSYSIEDALREYQGNTLATTISNERNPIEHRSKNITGAVITSDTPPEYHSVAMHNKNNLINLSSVSVKMNIHGTYIRDLQVLDLVEVKAGMAENKLAGNYLVEALEIGFVYGSPFTTVVWLCRDNFNDIENSVDPKLRKLKINELTIPAKTKAQIINATRTSRRALIHARNILDDTYVNEWQRHLIAMRTAALTNFWLFDTSIDLSSTYGRVNSLRNAGSILLNKFIMKFLDAPYNMTLYNFLMGGTNLSGVFFSVLSAILGADLYGEFYQLFSDIIMFDNFLENYLKTVNTINYNLYDNTSVITVNDFKSSQTNISLKPDVDFTTQPEGGNNVALDESTEVVSKIVDEIKQNIPEDVDIPIPEIILPESDIIKPENEIKEIIADTITGSLIDKGYVYDSVKVDNATEAGVIINIMKPDGTIINNIQAEKEMVSSKRIKDIFLGVVPFDSVVANKIKNTVGVKMKIRHWGTFVNENDLLSFIILQGFTDKYRTVTTTKKLTVKDGKRIFIALPASEKGVKFYINSQRVILNEMDIPDLGYYELNNKPIPYIIYYTSEGYNSNSVIVEIRKEI